MPFAKGYVPWNKGIELPYQIWNKGKTIKGDPRIAKLANNDGSRLKKFWFKKGEKPWNFNKTGYATKRLGQKHTEETKKKIGKNREGKIAWNKGLTAETDSRIKRPTREQIRKSLRRRPMSSLEIKFKTILNKYDLPYEFVGNGSFFLERINPDFINTNNEKIGIDIYYKRHKEQFRNKTIGEWKQERIDIFRKYGWNLLFFEASECLEENIVNTLQKLNCQKGGE